MTDESKRVGPEYDPRVGEQLRDSKGVPISNDYLDQVIREAEAGYDLSKARRVGRPSLSGEGQQSPKVTFRVSEEVRAEAERVAEQQGKTVSQLAREALERYLAS